MCVTCAQWVPEIKHHCPKTPFLLVGTQADLREDQGVIEKLARSRQKPLTLDAGERLARELKAVKYVECSALTQVRLATFSNRLTSPFSVRTSPCARLEWKYCTVLY